MVKWCLYQVPTLGYSRLLSNRTQWSFILSSNNTNILLVVIDGKNKTFLLVHLGPGLGLSGRLEKEDRVANQL